MMTGNIQDLTVADIEDLVTNAVRESRSLDFKREAVGGKDDDKREFLADVSSFANTIGGDLVFGVEEALGVATAAAGISFADPDAEIQRLESVLRTGLEPRLPAHQIRWIERTPGRGYLIVRTPRSWAAPHRVVFRDAKFYGRSESGKYPLDVAELRAVFLASEALPDRIRRFRTERATLIEVGEGALPLKPGARLVLHIIPVSAFVSPLALMVNERTALFGPIGASGFNYLHTLEGFATYSGPEGSTEGVRAYTLAFRNGIVEAVAVVGHTDQKDASITPASVELSLLRMLTPYLQSMQRLGIQPPFFIAVSLLGARGYRLHVRSWAVDAVQRPLNRDVLFLPEVEIQEALPPAELVLRPLFDLFWNAFGYPGSFSFDQQGRYVGADR